MTAADYNTLTERNPIGPLGQARTPVEMGQEHGDPLPGESMCRACWLNFYNSTVES